MGRAFDSPIRLPPPGEGSGRSCSTAPPPSATEDVEDVASAHIAGGMDRLGELVEGDAVGLDLAEPLLLDRAVLARREPQPAMETEELVELLEGLVGVVEGAG